MRPIGRVYELGPSVAYDKAGMDMWDDGGEAVVGMAVEGEIDWGHLFIGWKWVLAMNWYAKHFRVRNDSIFVERLLLQS